MVAALPEEAPNFGEIFGAGSKGDDSLEFKEFSRANENARPSLEQLRQLDLSGIQEARQSQELNKRDAVGNHTLNTDPSERGLFNELLN